MTQPEAQLRTPVGVAPESTSGRLVVVCDDGSVWKWFDDRQRWEEMPAIPGTRCAVGAGAGISTPA